MSSQVEEYRKKLSKMNKQQLIDFSLKTLTTPDEKEEELLEGVEEVIPEVYQELAKQLGGNVSDDQIPVMTELNPRQIYALSGLLCTMVERKRTYRENCIPITRLSPDKGLSKSV